MICASLFNGCGVGAVAMIRANLPITKFYYSEIDKYANIVMDTMMNVVDYSLSSYVYEMRSSLSIYS